MGRLIKHIKRWNVWRKHNKNGIVHKILVLFGIIKSPTLNHTWTKDECKAFYDGFVEGLKDGKYQWYDSVAGCKELLRQEIDNLRGEEDGKVD